MTPIDTLVARACQEPTLRDALAYAALWECERAIKQAHEFLSGRAGPAQLDGRGWDTCFGVIFDAVLEAYPHRTMWVGDARLDEPRQRLDGAPDKVGAQ